MLDLIILEFLQSSSQDWSSTKALPLFVVIFFIIFPFRILPMPSTSGRPPLLPSAHPWMASNLARLT